MLAEDVTAADAVPGFDNSAMDGYAVRAADTAGATEAAPGASCAVVGESRAGHPAGRELGAGEAIAISTGAMVPAGADAVVRVEDTDGGAETRRGPGRGRARATTSAAPARTSRPGERGARAPGRELGPAEVGVLASVGRAEVACATGPRSTVLTTGDELQEPGEPLRPGRDPQLQRALARRAGRARGRAARRRGDRPRRPRARPAAALERALAGELTVVSGGVSVGEHDHVRPALAELGVEQVFWGVALRPGKPT